MSEKRPGKKETPSPVGEPPRKRAPQANYVPDEAEREQTVKLSALDEEQLSSPDPNIALSFHRRVAARLLKDKAVGRACAELLRGAEGQSIDGAYAAELAQLARLAGMEAAAASALEAALARASEQHRPEIRRRLARLYRRSGRPAQARELLQKAVQEDARDVRARRMLVVTALQEESFALAAQQLAELEEAALRRGRLRSAARNALVRARLLEERLGDPLAAAAAYQRAAEHARAVSEHASVFSARLLAARALVATKVSGERLDRSLRELTEASRAARREAEAAAFVDEVGRAAGKGQAKTLALLAEAALARGAHQEAGALLRSAVEADPEDAALAARLESFFIGRGAWVELASLYRDRAKREPNPVVRAELLSRLAEVLEDEMSDRAGAAEIYAEIVSVSGDPAALAAQVRLLSASTDPAAVQAALDAAVQAAREPRARVEALLLRGEVHLGARRLDRAAADFQAALGLSPQHLRALAGLAECRADRATIEQLARSVLSLPRASTGRVSLMRRLARLLEWPLGEERRAREAWAEVLAENPADVEAEGRLIELARQANDREGLVRLLRRRLTREPRGVAARQARHELAHCLEAMGNEDQALEEWRMAARMEPGDAVALVALADRCEALGRLSEAAFALEGAAGATEAGPERAALWKRLAKLSRERLADPARAAACEERARQLLSAPQPTRSLSTPGVAVSPPAPPPRAPIIRTPTPSPMPALTPAELVPPQSPAADVEDDAIEVHTGDIVAIADERTAEAAGAAPDSSDTPLTASPVAPEPHRDRKRPRKRSSEEPKLLQRVQDHPLDAASYSALAEHFERSREHDRVAQMEEIARALEGDPFAEPLAPRFTLSATDWSALRHPDLRGAGAELFTIVGPAFASLDATTPKEAGVRRAFSMEESPGARVTGEALLAAVRVLGLRSPDVGVGVGDTPPLRAINTDPPQILVGRAAIGKRLSLAQLRFFAGRALVTFRPEMVALRLMAVDRLEECLEALRQIIDDLRPYSPEARELVRKIPEKADERIGQLLTTMERRDITLDDLNAGARHTSNRVGLLVAGGVAPAVTALRAKRDSEDELAELLRFAASDRYLTLRGRSR